MIYLIKLRYNYTYKILILSKFQHLYISQINSIKSKILISPQMKLPETVVDLKITLF